MHPFTAGNAHCNRLEVDTPNVDVDARAARPALSHHIDSTADPPRSRSGSSCSRRLFMAHGEAAAMLTAIKKATAMNDWGGAGGVRRSEPRIQRASVLTAECAGSRRSRAAITTGPTSRSKRVPSGSRPAASERRPNEDEPRRQPTCQAAHGRRWCAARSIYPPIAPSLILPRQDWPPSRRTIPVRRLNRCPLAVPSAAQTWRTPRPPVTQRSR